MSVSTLPLEALVTGILSPRRMDRRELKKSVLYPSRMSLKELVEPAH